MAGYAGSKEFNRPFLRLIRGCYFSVGKTRRWEIYVLGYYYESNGYAHFEHLEAFLNKAYFIQMSL